MYRFALRPRWILGHVLVLLLVVVMVNLGFWQLRRLHERRAENERIVERSIGEPAAVQDLAGKPIGNVEFRRVAAEGTFDASHEVLVGYRTDDGLPGFYVITPLALRDDPGHSVLVNRGFVPLEMANSWPVKRAAPPSGEVRVVGLLRKSYKARDRTVTIEKGDRVPKLSEVDIPAISTYVPASEKLLPVQVELQEPTPAGYPDPLPPLDLSEGPHFSYMVQWFIFSTIAVVGWGILLRRKALALARSSGPRV